MNNLENVMAYLKEKYSAEEIKDYFRELNKNAKTNLKKTGAVAMTIATLLGAGATMNSCKPENPIHYETVTDEHGNVITDESGVPVTSEVLDTTDTTTITTVEPWNRESLLLNISGTEFDLTKPVDELTVDDIIEFIKYTSISGKSLETTSIYTKRADFTFVSQYQDAYRAKINEISHIVRPTMSIFTYGNWEFYTRDFLSFDIRNYSEKQPTDMDAVMETTVVCLNTIKEENINKYNLAVEKSQEIVNETIKEHPDTTSEFEMANYLLDKLLEISEFKQESETNSKDDIDYAYGPLVVGEGNHSGYTAAYNMLLKTAGINCVANSSKGSAPGKGYYYTAWTGVLLDGTYYNIDSASADICGDKNKYISIDYNNFESINLPKLFTSYSNMDTELQKELVDYLQPAKELEK